MGVRRGVGRGGDVRGSGAKWGGVWGREGGRADQFREPVRLAPALRQVLVHKEGTYTSKPRRVWQASGGAIQLYVESTCTCHCVCVPLCTCLFSRIQRPVWPTTAITIALTLALNSQPRPPPHIHIRGSIKTYTHS